MQIIGQHTALKKSLASNLDKVTIRALVRPKYGIGFTFDRQKAPNTMVFAVHTSFKVEYSARAQFIFEGYDGTMFNSSDERPNENGLLIVVKEAIPRLNALLKKEIASNNIELFTEEYGFDFPDSDLLEMLRQDIRDNY